MQIKRTLHDTLTRTSGKFDTLILTGPPRSGKSTLLKTAAPDRPYLSLDDPLLRLTAVREPDTFFKQNPPPVILDGIQNAPEVLPFLDTKNSVFLSGTQQFHVMKNADTLPAGAVGVLNLLGLSLREISGVDNTAPFLPTEAYLNENAHDTQGMTYGDIWNLIHRGGLPEMVSDPALDPGSFYAAYVKAYLGRDVQTLTQIGDEGKFLHFMTVMAASTGRLLNLAAAAREVGVSQPTAERWLAVLKVTHMVYLLPPYFTEETKRAIKTPKVYFLDTGLAAWLTRWPTADTLRNGNQSNAFFETFVVSEIVKSYYHAGHVTPPLYFYKDKEQNEIDLILVEGHLLHPLAIEKHADPHRGVPAVFGVLDKIPGVKRSPGGVLCLDNHLLALNGGGRLIPVRYL